MISITGPQKQSNLIWVDKKKVLDMLFFSKRLISSWQLFKYSNQPFLSHLKFQII